MLGGAGSPGGDDHRLTVTVIRDEFGYGMKVSGDNPVYVQSVKEHGAAWRAGLRAGDRILCVDSLPVHHHTHQQVVQMIRANAMTVLTVQQNTSRHKTPITAPVPVNSEKQRQLEVSKVHTVRLMLEKEQKFIRDLKNELAKVPDVRKQAQLESAEQRCSKLQQEIDTIMAGQPASTPRLGGRTRTSLDKASPAANAGFLSALPRSLSNLTGQSLRSLRQARPAPRASAAAAEAQAAQAAQAARRNHTVPPVPTTCLDGAPPPLPPRAAPPRFAMHRSLPPYDERLGRSSHSLDGELEGPPPNSIALQLSYPLVNAPPPPLQTERRAAGPVLHVRSRSSPDQMEHQLTSACAASPLCTVQPLPLPLPLPPPPAASPAPLSRKEWAERDTPPPGTPPPPYHTNAQPCSDPQRAIISMEEDDSPASEQSYSGLFSTLRSVRESRARTAVLLNWLLGERRCACACLLLVLTDGFRAARGVPPHTLRRWAYEIHSTFLVPDAALRLSGADENMANEIEHVLVNEYDKEELLRNVFRKARQRAKDELSQQLTEFQVKRQVGLGTLYGPEDGVLARCAADAAQELLVVEQLLCAQLRALGGGGPAACGRAKEPDALDPLLAALIAAALCLHCRPASVAAAVGGQRPSFLQRDKLYKQRCKQISKQHPQPLVVRGHHLQLQALTSVGHCHHCGNTVGGLAPQAYVCSDCKLRVHRECARRVEESCCLDGDHHNNRISRFMERIHANQTNNQDAIDKKARKASGAAHFLNMERSFRKAEDDAQWDQTLTPSVIDRRVESDESLYESADGHSDAISASDDALPRLGKTPTISKESLKLAVTDEEVDLAKKKKGHRKTMSLSNPLEIVKSLGDELFESARRELDKNSDKKKSRESLWSEEDRESIHGSTMKLDQIRKNSKKEDKSQSISRKSSTIDPPKTRKTSKGSTVSALNFLRRKKTPTSNSKPVESVAEDVKVLSAIEILNATRLFLEGEKHYASISEWRPTPVETDSEDEPPTPKQIAEHRRRLSRQTSRSKSKVRGKSQSLKVNTLRKSHSGTLKKGKKKSAKAPSLSRSRQASLVEQTPIVKKKSSDSMKQNSWLFSASRGESRREGSTDEPTAPDADVDTSDANSKEPDKDNNWRSPTAQGGGRGVNRAESCRERDAPRRGKHRNASDPNRLTAHNNHDLEPGAATAPSGSSSSSSLSSRSNESNTVAAEQQASQSDWSEEDEPLAAQWADSLPPQVLDSLVLCARLRKRQEVIHELIVSEGSHVRWLRVLSGVFLRPLERHVLLAGDELRALFPNLPAVRERHTRLYADLRAVKSGAPNHVVQIRGVADAVLNTLGEAGYAACVSKFCRGQRMALEALRERRRKSKELHQFLAAKEQLPICGRLQLRDMLACVWQRLTKYQLLLESILKTVVDSDSESDADIAQLRRALGVAKDVLHRVDTAIRTAENEHRLRSIQSKLEVRAGGDWEELRRFELCEHELRLEGELTLRNDSAKRINVLALMLEDCLVLLHKEGDKFVLKPFPQSSHQLMLSPIIKWDKVLFRPNAAVRNTFFLMNINGVQMHELSANSGPEYATWVKYIQEAPLAKLAEFKSSITPSHQPSRSADDSGINVSRNPSDASEKSSAEAEAEPSPAAPPEAEAEAEADDLAPELAPVAAEDRPELEKETEVADKQEKHTPRRPTVGRISTHGAEPPAQLEPSQALTIQPPAAAKLLTAQRVYTHHERLRRLDDVIARSLLAKSGVVAELLAVPRHSFAQLADLAVADTLGQVDVSSDLAASRANLSRSNSEDDQHQQQQPDMHQLLLAAHAQATQLIRLVSGALSVSESGAVAARARGRCDRCRPRLRSHASALSSDAEPFEHIEHPDDSDLEMDAKAADLTSDATLERDVSRLVAESDATLLDAALMEDSAEDALESDARSALLATRLVGVASGLQQALSRLLSCAEPGGRELRQQLAALRDQNDALKFQRTEDISFSKEGVDPSIQDKPSNGG